MLNEKKGLVGYLELKNLHKTIRVLFKENKHKLIIYSVAWRQLTAL